MNQFDSDFRRLIAHIEVVKSNLNKVYSSKINIHNFISFDDALKLYCLDSQVYNKYIKIPKDVLFCFLSSEEQEKRLEEIENFDYFDIRLLKYIKSYLVKDKITLLSIKNNWLSNVNFFTYAIPSLEKLYEYAMYILENNKTSYDYFVIRALDRIKNPQKLETLLYAILKNDSGILNFLHLDTIISSIYGIEDENVKYDLAIKLMNKKDIHSIILINDWFMNLVSSLSLEYKNEIVNTILNKKIVDIKRAIKYLSLLPFANIKEYIENDVLDIKDIMENYFHFSRDIQNEIYNLVKEDEDYHYLLTYNFIYSRALSLSGESRKDFFNNDIIDNPNISLFQKAQLIGELFSENDLLEVLNNLLAIKYWKIRSLENDFEVISIISPLEDESFLNMFDDIILNVENLDKCDLNNYINIKNLIIERYEIKNINNFDKFVSVFGAKSILYLNDNIKKFINFNEKDFIKILALFSNKLTNLSMNDIYNITHIFLQRRFKYEYKQEYSIFTHIQHLIQNNEKKNVKEVKSLFNDITSLIEIKKYTNLSVEEFIEKLFAHDRKSIDVLHNITNAYIAKKRQIYIEKNLDKTLDFLNLGKYYNRRSLKKEFIRQMSVDHIYSTIYYGQHVVEYNEEEKELVNKDEEYLVRLIQLKKNVSGINLAKVGNKLIILDNILDKLYDSKLLTIAKITPQIKYDYIVPHVQKEHLLSILINMNFSNMDKYLKNDELYLELINYLNKYKIMGWGNIFMPIQDTSDLKVESYTIASLINNFDVIKELITSRATLVDYLDYANAYASSSNKYRMLLGSENYDYICANSGSNAAGAPKDIRLNKVPNLIKNMYQRDKITIPNGNKNIKLKSGNEIEIVIGDIYNPMILSYGERTYSCLRISGFFEDLFEYCITNPNGFHVRFQDPSDKTFISRVSGFRNGNTVFLNELRNSEYDKYSNKDLVEAIKYVSMFLVESTKEDLYPIDNVIISNELAMENELIDDLMFARNIDPFLGLHFNITDEGCILYTSDIDNKSLIPYKFGDKYAQTYIPFSNEVYSINEKETTNIVFNRIHLINELLNGKSLDETLLITPPENIKNILYGNGWIVYSDTKGNIYEFVVDKLKDHPLLRNLIEETKKTLGGKTYETKR